MRISVIVPTYNRGHLVGEAIGSILAQTRPADEIVVVDDGSPDDTQDRLAAFGERIVAIRQENAGAAAARNAGLRRASGDWITFLDDDDVWHPDRLAVLARDLAEAEPGIEVHLANMRYVGEGYDYDEMEMLGVEAPQGRAARIEDMFVPAARGFQLDSLACTRRLALALGGFDTRLMAHEDKLFTGLLGHGRPWLVTGDLVAEARRIPGDTQALTALSSANGLGRYRGMLYVNDRFRELDLTPAQRRHVLASRHVTLMRLARALFGTGAAGEARRHLLEAARCHPSALRGWAKIVPPLMLGRAGFALSRLGRSAYAR
jgi:glycosyltransferase involved in cell wall biosynthesis